MCSARDNTALPVLGFPIRASAGHWLFSASPRLIAAVHALHRLLVPRHPPCALTILTVILLGGDRSLRPVIPVYIGYCAVFKVREEAQARAQHPGQKSAGSRRGPISQNSAACDRPRAKHGPALQARSTFLVQML